jgi:serine/threonine protein kinase
MAESDRDRNLLVGVLALQMDFVSRDQLIEAMQIWLTNRDEKLEDLLCTRGLINKATCDFLSDLAAKHLELHAQDLERSLSALSSLSSIENKLDDLQDAEITQVFSRAKKLQATDETLDSGATSQSVPGSAKPAEGDPERRESTRFHVLRPYAKGGLGIVSVARDNELNREVALKEIRGNHAHDEVSRTRFLVEAEVTGRLEHPGIVPVYSLGQSKAGTPFYVMRLIRGNSLKEAIADFYDAKNRSRPAEERRIHFRDLVKRLIDVCQAIDYAHSRGVLHRDLKPGNIMLGRYGETLVVDWGLAKTIGREETQKNLDEATLVPSSGEGSTDTRFGSVVGTLAYMSPEQAEGLVDSLGPRSDVYCLGATLYSVLTGESPIEKSSTIKMVDNIRTGRFAPVKQRNPDADSALAAICEKAMSLEPNDRYPTAASLMEDLERWLADVPVEAYPEPWLKRLGRFAKRHRTLVASLLAVLVVSIPALSIFGIIVSSKNRQLTEIQTDLRDLAVSSLSAAERQLRSTPGLEQFRNQVMQESFDTLDRLHTALSDDKQLAEYLANSARLSANQLARTNKSLEGQERMDFAIDLQRQILSEAADQDQQKRRLSQMLRDLSGIQMRNGRLPQAKESIDESIVLINELRDLMREDLDLDQTEGLTQLAEIGVQYDFWDLEEALVSAKQSVRLLGNVVRQKSKTDADITSWLLARAWEGRLLDELGRHGEARTAFEKAIGQARNILKQKPGSRNFQYTLSRLLHWDARGSVRERQDVDDAELASCKLQIDEAVEMMATLHSDYPESEGFHANYGDALIDHALIRWKADANLEPALKICNQAITTLKQLTETSDSPGNKEYLGLALLNKAEILGEAGQTEAAKEPLSSSISLLESASREVPDSQRLKALVERVHELQENS